LTVRVVVQRVAGAAVRRVDAAGAAAAARIGPGLLLLAGFRAADDDATLAWMAEKVLGLRIFADDAGAMNRSVAEVGGALLVVPNFTLYGDARKGRRPSFTEAAAPARAAERFDAFVALLRRGPVPVESGFFQAHMHVELVNDGPVTLLLER
jgi:D-tyrosyl-tRNA(Tyr) deacylase